jgi:hypothetical protein
MYQGHRFCRFAVLELRITVLERFLQKDTTRSTWRLFLTLIRARVTTSLTVSLQNHHSQKLASTTYEAKKEIDTEKTTVSCRHFNLLLDCSSAHSYNMVDFAKRPEVTVSTMVSGGLLQRSSDRQRRRIPFRNLPCNSECE